LAQLLDEIRSRSASALASGALVPITTEARALDADGARFLVCILERVAAKESEARTALREARNPFLPPDPALVVRELSATHVAVLNKFPVLANHLLIITRAFEAQESALTRADLEAAWIGLREIDGLVFYNAGSEAGASQPHKHLQLVPLPLGLGFSALAGEALFAPACRAIEPGRNPALPFEHAGCRVADVVSAGLERAAAATHERYRALLAALALGTGRPRPHNLLLTRRWLALIPRRRSELDGMPVNALGYAGALLVRDAPAFDRLRELGARSLLREVGFPTQS
jgi:ATP adenylyltransferase